MPTSFDKESRCNYSLYYNRLILPRRSGMSGRFVNSAWTYLNSSPTDVIELCISGSYCVFKELVFVCSNKNSNQLKFQSIFLAENENANQLIPLK